MSPLILIGVQRNFFFRKFVVLLSTNAAWSGDLWKKIWAKSVNSEISTSITMRPKLERPCGSRKWPLIDLKFFGYPSGTKKQVHAKLGENRTTFSKFWPPYCIAAEFEVTSQIWPQHDPQRSPLNVQNSWRCYYLELKTDFGDFGSLLV